MAGTGSSLGSRASTTVMGEGNRQQQADGAQAIGRGFNGTQRGIITEISPDGKPLIKARLFQAGKATEVKIAWDRWIPLNHSSLEIAERWGTIRKNMIVMVFFSGYDGSDVSATITGLEYESPGQEAIASNEVQMGVHKIFSPGIGMG
jgi:hypothetical protein